MWQSVIDETTNELISAFERDGSVDMMKQFAIPLPVRVVARILASTSPPPPTPTLVRRVSQVSRRLEHPEKENLLTALVGATAEGGSSEGESLTLDEVRSITNQLMVAGNETTTQLIGQLMHAVVTTPGLFERLRANRAGGRTVEEGLHFTSPVTGLYRPTSRDATVGTCPVPKDAVLFDSASARTSSEPRPAPRSARSLARSC
jgi:cytochrome P450